MSVRKLNSLVSLMEALWAAFHSFKVRACNRMGVRDRVWVGLGSRVTIKAGRNISAILHVCEAKIGHFPCTPAKQNQEKDRTTVGNMSVVI